MNKLSKYLKKIVNAPTINYKGVLLTCTSRGFVYDGIPFESLDDVDKEIERRGNIIQESLNRIK